MKRLCTYLLYMAVAAIAIVQVNVAGKVVDKENGKPLSGASSLSREQTAR